MKTTPSIEYQKKQKLGIQTLKSHNITLENTIEIEDLLNLQEMINILKCEKIIGMDCEWHNAKNKVDLFQIGTKKNIFFIKINILFNKKKYEWNFIKKKKFDELIKILITDIFHNKEIIKVSFDFKHDALFLRNRFPDFKELLVYEKMFDFRYIDQEDFNGNKIYGLALHSEIFLKKKMNKNEQQSDWVKRNLTDRQKIYAALDVLVVLELFEFFQEYFPEHKAKRVVYAKSDVEMFEY